MRFPNLAQWKQFFKILSSKEKLVFFIFAFLTFASATTLAAFFYLDHTESVPADNGAYAEGVVGRPRFLNPVYAGSNSTDQDISQLLFSGILDYGKNGKIVGGLADYKISDDGKTYDFILKDGLHWSDGAPITSDDVIYTVKTIQDANYKSPLRPQWIGVEAEKVSDTSFRFKLKDPYASFLENCTLGILPEHAWRETNADSFPLSPLNLKPVVSGPYFVKKLNLAKDGTANSIILEKNTEFNGSKPHLSIITFDFFDDYDSLASAFKRGRVQGYIPSTNLSGTIPAGTNSYAYSLPRYFAIFFNPDNNKAFADIQVRMALAYGTDKKEILDKALGNKGAIVDFPIPPDVYGLTASATSTTYGYDVEKASQILDNAGYKQGTDGLRVKTINRTPAFQFTRNLTKGTNLSSDVKELQKCLAREVAPGLEANGNFSDKTIEAVKAFQNKYRKDILDPQNVSEPSGDVKLATRDKLNEVCFPSGNQSTPLAIRLTVANQKPFTTAAQLIKTQWAKIGVTVNINAVETSNMDQDIVKPRTYDAIIFGQALGIIPDPYPFWNSSQKIDPGLNFSMYESDDADKLLENIRQTSDQNTRNNLLETFNNLISKDEPAIFLYNPDYIYIASKDIKGIRAGIIADPEKRFDDIADWYSGTTRIWKNK
jgi:ABC-type transport system substrate-binding protein